MYVGRGRTHPSCCIGASLQQFLYPIQRGVAKIKIPTLVDVIPADRNVMLKVGEKKQKYKSLCLQIQRMWYMKCTIISVVIGVPEQSQKVSRETWNPCQEDIQQIDQTKTAVLGNSHVIREGLQSESSTLSGGNRRWFKGSTRKKRPVTREIIIIIIIIIISIHVY